SCADAVGEYRPVLIAVLGGGSVAEGQGGAGSARDVAEGRAAVGAHLPLHRGRGVAAGRRREGGRLAGGHRLAGRLGGDRGGELGRVHSQGGRIGSSCADAVGEYRLVLVAVLGGGGGEAGVIKRGARDVDEGRAAVGAHLPLHRGRGVAAGRRREGGRLAGSHRLAGRLGGDRGGELGRVHSQGGRIGSSCADAVGEYRLVLVAVLGGGGGEAEGGAGGARDVDEGDAAVGAHLPLHRGRGVAAGRRREGGRLAGGHRLAGRLGGDRGGELGRVHSQGGRIGSSCADAVGE